MMNDNLLLAVEQLAGFLLVMSALVLLWGLTALVGKVFGQPGPAAPSSPIVRQPETAAADVPEEDVVIIAAAVALLLDAPHRVVAVRPLPSSWGQQGRRDIHDSHRIR